MIITNSTRLFSPPPVLRSPSLSVLAKHQFFVDEIQLVGLTARKNKVTFVFRMTIVIVAHLLSSASSGVKLPQDSVFFSSLTFKYFLFLVFKERFLLNWCCLYIWALWIFFAAKTLFCIFFSLSWTHSINWFERCINCSCDTSNNRMLECLRYKHSLVVRASICPAKQGIQKDHCSSNSHNQSIRWLCQQFDSIRPGELDNLKS